MVAGCGASSHTPTATTVGGASTSSTVSTGGGAPSSGSTAAGAGSPGVAFAACMRSSGVPNFPDPSPGGGLLFRVTAGIDRSSPAFRAARAKCRKLLPGGGPPGPGSTTHPSAQTLAKLLKIAQCMRQHGISQFPDPRTSVPLNPFGSGYGVITDYDGAILLFPSTIDMQSPAYRQDLAACGAPPLGLQH